MIRRLSINILDWATLVVMPPHKRQALRTAFIKGLFYPLQEDSDSYNTWVNDSIIRATVTGQTGSLEWYLNYRFDPDLKRIKIIHGILVGTPLSLAAENGNKFRLSLSSEDGSKQGLKLTGENISSLPLDFRVQMPDTINEGQIRQVIDTYRQRGKLYDIEII